LQSSSYESRKKGTDNEIAKGSKVPVAFITNGYFVISPFLLRLFVCLRVPYAFPTSPGSLTLMKQHDARITAVANFRFPISGGVLYGYLSEKGVQALHLYPGTASPPPWHPLALHLSLERRLHGLFERYFAGHNTDFASVPLDLETGTVFQRRVWRAACAVPYGDTASYGTLARDIGAPRAARAVGTALGANPVILLVPCHRIIAGDGSLGGYGPGLHWKQRFLGLEQGISPQDSEGTTSSG